MIGCVCGPIGRSIPSLIARIAGPPDTDDPAVLDPDVRLDDADDRIDDERAGDDDVELRRAGPPLGRARVGWSSRSPRSARRRAPGGPRRPGPRGRCRPGGRGRRSSGRSGRAVRPGESRLTVVRLAAEPDQADGPRLAGRPALGRAGRQVEAEAARGLAVEDEPRGSPGRTGSARRPGSPASIRCGPRGCAVRVRPARGGRPSPAGSRPGRHRRRRRRPSGSTARRVASRRPSAPRAGPRRPARGRRRAPRDGSTAARPAASTSS